MSAIFINKEEELMKYEERLKEAGRDHLLIREMNLEERAKEDLKA